ncbi:hypothetical protein F5J09_04895 [Lacticaseibacillus paracasei]|jgi:hypothetical protein|nr:hypothetical protein F5J09_04895 [Lacticaseibacillus paracasei]DAZ10628.1 MAG TPA: hypothetical protein [Caudoviricetes sp.]
MAQMITTKYGVYMPKVEAWAIGKIDREIVRSRSNQVKTRGGYAHPESKVCLSKRGWILWHSTCRHQKTSIRTSRTS